VEGWEDAAGKRTRYHPYTDQVQSEENVEGDVALAWKLNAGSPTVFSVPVGEKTCCGTYANCEFAGKRLQPSSLMDNLQALFVSVRKRRIWNQFSSDMGSARCKAWKRVPTATISSKRSPKCEKFDNRPPGPTIQINSVRVSAAAF
jgi:hypothetical protein